MPQHMAELHRLEELSRDLVRFFLSGSGFGVILPKRIILYGSPQEVLILVAHVMRKELTGHEDVAISILGRSKVLSVKSDSYYIDVDYFIAHAFRAETRTGEETKSQGLLRSETEESDHPERCAQSGFARNAA